MAQTVVERESPSTDGGRWRRPGQGPADRLDDRVAYGIIHAPTHSQWTTGVEMRELRLTDMGDEWRVMLKGERRGKPVVAFLHAATWRDAIVLCATSLDTGNVLWRPDRYPGEKT